MDGLCTDMFGRGWGQMRWAERNVEGAGENMPVMLASEGARP